LKTILVTGIAGFLGSHVAEQLLKNGHRVLGVDNLSTGFERNVPKGAEFKWADYGDAKALERAFGDTTVHAVYHIGAFAAECLSPFAPTYTHLNNTVGTASLLAWAVNKGVKLFVFTSSIAVYGDKLPPFKEADQPAPIDTYGASKACSENDVRMMTDRFGMRHVIFRPFNIYGSRQSLDDPFRNVVGIFMRHALLKKPFPIFGDGEQVRAFSHVNEVAPVIAAAIDRPGSHNKTFNVGGGIKYTVNMLAERVAQAMGIEPKVEHLPARHETMIAYSDRAVLLEQFGDLVRPVPLSDGLDEMARWAQTAPLGQQKKFAFVEIKQKFPPSWLPFVE